MGYRILVDENVETEVAIFLRSRGHHAEHVQENVGKGTDDFDLAIYARENELAILTDDYDFLRPRNDRGVPVFYVSDKRTPPKEIVNSIDRLTDWGLSQDDLGRVIKIPPVE